MATGGVGGPKGPGGPSGPGQIGPAEGAERRERVGEAFRVGDAADAAATAPSSAVAGDPMVSEAVARAASDLSAGRIADVRAAVNAVIEAIVSERYPAMETRQRQRFTASLQRLLADDPGIGAQLAALIEAKRDTPQ